MKLKSFTPENTRARLSNDQPRITLVGQSGKIKLSKKLLELIGIDPVQPGSDPCIAIALDEKFASWYILTDPAGFRIKGWQNGEYAFNCKSLVHQIMSSTGNGSTTGTRHYSVAATETKGLFLIVTGKAKVKKDLYD